MTKRWIFSVRWKLLLAMLLSALITGIVLFVTATLASSLIDREPFSGPIKWWINTLGSTVILCIIGGSLFITCYILFTRSVITQLLQVQADLKQMSKGDFQLKISLQDRKSTRLNSSHVKISYAFFCLKKKSDIM